MQIPRTSDETLYMQPRRSRQGAIFEVYVAKELLAAHEGEGSVTGSAGGAGAAAGGGGGSGSASRGGGGGGGGRRHPLESSPAQPSLRGCDQLMIRRLSPLHKSSQVIALPIAKSQTRNHDKDALKGRSAYSERGISRRRFCEITISLNIVR
jgi:hypothetical protein